MDIIKIKNNLEKINNSNFQSIIELIINAVSEYPKFGMTDTDEYFLEIKKLINTNKITLEIIGNYLKLQELNMDSKNEENENRIWVISSLSSLADAFDLMRINNIDFIEVLDKIKMLDA